MRVFLTLLFVTACGPQPPRPDGGTPDGGTVATTCSSGMRWTLGVTGREQMNPGYACRSCHLGENFEGQNPTLVSNMPVAMFFMGTAFSSFSEANLCFAAVPDGGVIEILGPGNSVVLSLPIDPLSGNFRSGTVAAGVSLPYGARIRANGKTRQMSAKQMSGDCNSCHTEQGNQGAPGRIVFP